MKVKVFFNDKLAGILEKNESGYYFKYSDDYLNDPSSKSISLTLPKHKKEFFSSNLFPFFHGLLSEGYAKTLQSRKLKIDESDYFTRLIKTAGSDTIGCVTVEEIND
jgi:serine/threonine-protein kinase HipA